MALVGQAEAAHDAAAALHQFLEHVPDHDAELTALISELYAVSSALRGLSTTIVELQHTGAYGRISAEVGITLESMVHTFGDFNRLLGGFARYRHLSNRAAHGQVWDDIDEYFHVQSNCPFKKRLQYYKSYLLQMEHVIEQGYPVYEEDYLDLGDRIEALLEKQNREADLGVGNLSLGQTAAQRQRSFERRRPHVPPLATQAPPRHGQQAHHPHRGGRRWPRPLSPQSPGYDADFTYSPPAPEVPLSPTTTNTTATRSSRSTSSSSHWVPRLFEQSQSTTAFRAAGQGSACFDDDMPGASARLNDEYDKLLEMPFESGDLVVRLYQRAPDERARIHCRTLRPSRARKQCSVYLTSLVIARRASTLELCRRGRPPHLWTRLRFPNYERLVLFFCTFLALRADDGEAGNHIADARISGEDRIFHAEISDDSFPHALSVFRDRETHAVRLQASVLEGELKRKPVWTAFVTHQISSRSWVAKPSAKVIHLADLQRFVFADAYTPQLGPAGQHELTFRSRDDARDFLRAIDTLRAESHGV